LKAPVEPLNYTELKLQSDLTYEEEPSKILVENWKRLKNIAIKYCKVQQKHHLEREATREKEEDFGSDYPKLFSNELHIFRSS
jgi:hypothetical protein